MIPARELKTHAPDFSVMMKKLFALLLYSALVSCFSQGIQAQTNLPAFPGAEGFGRLATGGRGGTVYHVTHLNDSGPGSFRDAVSKPHRTVVFNVGGLIEISRRVVVSSNVTIAGQTAPGDGISIYGNGVSFSDANDSITRHLRFRMGVKGDAGKDAVAIAHGNNMIFDHVSVSWGRDETFSISGPVTNITIQNCIVGQGLQHHSAGGLIQTSGGVSILRTLYVDNYTRNPKVKGVNQYVNNVVYNWGRGGGYILGDSAGPSFANVMNNYFINGPNAASAAFIRGNLNFRIHAVNNFQDGNRNGVLDGAVIPREDYGVVAWQETPFEYPPLTMLSPSQAFKTVVAKAGASRQRDAVDRRLIAEVLSFGKLGQIITNENDAPIFGPGTINGGQAPADADRDGMPDIWETALGLDPGNSEDRNQITGTGYTQLEEYLNWRAEPHAIASGDRPVDLDLRPFTGGRDVPGFSVSGAAHCTAAMLQDGFTVRITFETGFSGRAGFRFSTRETEPVAGTFGLLVTKPEPSASATSGSAPATVGAHN
jgi:pectate lyase